MFVSYSFKKILVDIVDDDIIEYEIIDSDFVVSVMVRKGDLDRKILQEYERRGLSVVTNLIRLAQYIALIYLYDKHYY